MAKAAMVGLLMLCAVSVAGAQPDADGSRYGVWFIPSSVDIDGIAVGPFLSLWRTVPNTTPRRAQIVNGAALEIVGAGILTLFLPDNLAHPNNYFSVDALADAARNKGGVNGVLISATGSMGKEFIHGIAVGGIGCWILEIDGISVHGLMSFSHRLNGICAGFYNDTRTANGLQIGLLGNRAEDMAGMQIGVFNRTEQLRGVQIGLCNECYGSLSGVQIGLLNIGPGGWMPGLNVRF